MHDSANGEVLAKLRSLHPQEALPPTVPTSALITLEFPGDEESVAERQNALHKAINGFPKDSAPGPSGLRPDHVKAMLGTDDLAIIPPLDAFVKNCLLGGYLATITLVLGAARLVPLRKGAQSNEEVVDAFGNLLDRQDAGP